MSEAPYEVNPTMDVTEGPDVYPNLSMVVANGGNDTAHHPVYTVEDRPSYDSVVRSIRTIIVPSICVIGFLGNILNLVVLTRLRYRKAEGRKESATHTGLIVLAVSDLMFCLALFPRGFVPDSSALFDHKDFWLYYHVYQSGLVTTFILVSTWITVIMALMRYIGICHPFSSRKFDGPLCSKIAYLLTYLLCILFNLPTFWYYKITDISLGGQVHYLVDLGYFNRRRVRIFTVFKLFIGIIIPAVLMAFCNLSLIRALRKSYQMRRQCHVQENVSRQSNRITLTLVVIIIAFIVLVFPCELMNICSDFFQMSASRTEVFILVRAFANLLEVTNFAFNFVLYCTINVNFRSVLKEVVTCQACRRGSGGNRMMRQVSTRTSTTNVQYSTRNGQNMRLSRYESVAV